MKFPKNFFLIHFIGKLDKNAKLLKNVCFAGGGLRRLPFITKYSLPQKEKLVVKHKKNIKDFLQLSQKRVKKKYIYEIFYKK